MAATAESVTGRTIRVYCPIHKVGFDASDNRTILCSSNQHALADAFPNESFWEYCCDCQHCWLIDTSKKGAASDECPACERTIVRRFVCASCNVISIESDTPGRRKVFSLSSHGIPNPTCPGCLKKPPRNVLEHECADLGASFLTTLSACPFCDEVLEAPPAFPCSVSTYVERLRAPTTTVAFDAQSNTLQESPAGDYVLIPRVPGTNMPIVIPKASKFSSKRDYYDIYYELFNCDNAGAGEVIILSAAIVEKCDSGWLVKEPGNIQIKNHESRPAGISEGTIICSNCSTVGNPSHEFCGRCGAVLKAAAASQSERLDSAGLVNQPYPEQLRTASPYATSFVPTNQRPGEISAGGAASALDNLNSAYVSSVAPTASAPVKNSIVPKVILGAVAGVFLLVVIIAIAVSSAGNTVEKQLDDAITKGNLFPPPVQNAHDLYSQLKNGGANEETLRRYRDRLIPLLTSRPYQLISDLPSVGGDEPTVDQWQEAAKELNWAVELKPGDKKLAARAAYCEGRAAFLQRGQADVALQSWNRAANLDQSWALPVNGMGLIYQSRKDYATSSSYFLRAMNLDPNWAHPYENLGNDRYYEKDYSAAREFYQKALEKAPDWAKPHLHLGQIALELQDYSAAASEFEAALSPTAKGMKGKEVDFAQQGLDRARRKLSGG